MLIQFPVVGLFHDYYGAHPEELDLLSVGTRVLLRIEEQNDAEECAVKAMIDGRRLGYVATEERRHACDCIVLTGQSYALASLCQYDRERKRVWVEMEVPREPLREEQLPLKRLAVPYAGPLLPEQEDARRAYDALRTIQMLINLGNPWDEQMEERLRLVESYLWLDPSGQTFRSLQALRTDLIGEAKVDVAIIERLDRLQGYMGSEEARRRMLRHLREAAADSTFREALSALGVVELRKLVFRSGTGYVQRFRRHPELLLGSLWYEHLDRQSLRQLLSLLATDIWLREEHLSPKGRPLQPFFRSDNALEHQRLTHSFMAYLGRHHIPTACINTVRDNRFNEALFAFVFVWQEQGMVDPAVPAAAIRRFLTDQCGLPLDVCPSAYDALLRKRRPDPVLVRDVRDYLTADR